MTSKPLFSSSSKKRLEEFRSKLELNFRSKVLSNDEKVTSLASKRKASPFLRLKDYNEDLQKSITPKKNQSPVLSHYRNLSYFKNQASPKSQAKNINEIFKNPGLLNFDSNDKRNERLSDLISIETLSAATKIISRGGIKAVPRVYAAQLKEFCTEVLENIR
jgi:hypothetical protein